MSEERDAAGCVRAVIRADNARDSAGYRALLHDDYEARVHGHVTVTNADDEVAALAQWWAACSDVVLEPEALHTEGERATLLYSLTGTNDGPFFGREASGRPFRVHNCTVFEITGGKVARVWRFSDTLGLMTQLGFLES